MSQDKNNGKTEVKKPETDKKNGANRTRNMMKKVPVGPGNFWNNMLSTILVLMLMVVAYSYFFEQKTEPDEISVSEIATQVKNGEVKERASNPISCAMPKQPKSMSLCQ